MGIGEIMTRIIKLNNVNKQLIWGSEDWVVSGHKNGMGTILGGEFDQMTIEQLISERPDIFNHQVLSELPLLIKIIDARDDLSIQVHPGDQYAEEVENSLGKTECWYILGAADDADIIVGHHAKDKKEMQEYINDQNVMELLDVKPVNQGDFFYIPSGTIHAIRRNTKILEVQQSSDITYRLYDYQRLSDGQLRELHINKALDVIDFNQAKMENKVETKAIDNGTITCLVKSEFFDVYKCDITGVNKLKNDFDYILGVTLSGNITINGEVLAENQGFIIPHGVDILADGTGEFAFSTIVRR